MGSPYDLSGGMSWQDYMNQMQNGTITPAAAAADNAAQNNPASQPAGAFTGTALSAPQSVPPATDPFQSVTGGGDSSGGMSAPPASAPAQGGIGTLGVDPASMLVRAELGGGTGAGGNFSNTDLGVINQESAMAGVTSPPSMFNGWGGARPGGAFSSYGAGQPWSGSPGGFFGAFSSPSYMPSVSGTNGWGNYPPLPMGGSLPAAGVDGSSFVPNAPMAGAQQTAFGSPQTAPQPYGQFSQPTQNSSRFIF